MRVGDLIVDVDGTPVQTAADLQRRMLVDSIGRRLPVRVIRDGNAVDLTVVPVELTD